jgi:hypothetical protein
MFGFVFAGCWYETKGIRISSRGLLEGKAISAASAAQAVPASARLSRASEGKNSDRVTASDRWHSGKV